jgi:hypothetical protein
MVDAAPGSFQEGDGTRQITLVRFAASGHDPPLGDHVAAWRGFAQLVPNCLGVVVPA